MDWFLYDRDLCHVRIKLVQTSFISENDGSTSAFDSGVNTSSINSFLMFLDCNGKKKHDFVLFRYFYLFITK